MMEFGKTLRAAREAKGLTTGQIAERTHMMVQTVEGLENENFSKIVAPIYGRGFVKLYCETVGLEPQPMVDAFMEIYSSRRGAPHPAPKPVTPPIPEAAANTVDEPQHDASVQSPVPVAPEPPRKPAELDFGLSTPPSTAPASTPAPTPTPVPKQQSLSRYAASIPQESESSFSLPYVNWRLVALVACAFVILLFVALGIRAVYRATMRAPEPPPVEETVTGQPAAASPQPAAASSQPKQAEAEPPAASARQPLPLKPFYIDSDHSTELERKK